MKKLIIAAALAALPLSAMAGHHEKGDHDKMMHGAATPDALGTAFCAAVIAEDTDALATLYTEDADSYGPGGDVVKGRAAIVASWAPFFDGFDNLTCALNEAGSINNDDNATTWGTWEMVGTPADGGEPVVMKGRYMDAMIKTDMGWQYTADHASMMN